jgi:hypothetical protein
MKYAPQNVVRHANKLARDVGGENCPREFLAALRDVYVAGWQDAMNGVGFDNQGEKRAPKEPHAHR